MRKLFLGLAIVIIAAGVVMGFPQTRPAMGNMVIAPSSAEVAVTATPGTEPPPPPPTPPEPPPSPTPLPPVVAFVNGVPQPGAVEATAARATKPVRVFAPDMGAYLDFGTGTLFSFNELTDVTHGVVLNGAVYPVEFLEWMGGVGFAVSGQAPGTGSFQFVGPVYEGYPAGARFSPPGTITIGYDEALIPPDMTEAELRIYRYDAASGQWQTLPDCVVDTASNTITAPVSRFSLFSVLGLPSAPSFVFSALSVEPRELAAGGEVVISFVVTNEGNAAGSYDARLAINDIFEKSWTASLAAGESRTLTYSVAANAAGLYNIEVGGLTGTFRVEEGGGEVSDDGFSWWLWAVIAVAVLAAGAVFWLFWRRRVKL